MSKRKMNGISAKGYYIALILCAVAIGISGSLYYTGTTEKPDSDVTVAATNAAGENDLQVVATQPHNGATEGTDATNAPAVTNKSLQTVSPLKGDVVAAYAMDSLHYNQTTRDWRVHNGIDIAAQAGTDVCAAAAGQVYTVYEDDTMGTTVVIRHDEGYVTKYASLAQQVSVKAGDTVTMGQKIGTVGNTALLENASGDHLHFSVTCNDAPVDPAKFLG